MSRAFCAGGGAASTAAERRALKAQESCMVINKKINDLLFALNVQDAPIAARASALYPPIATFPPVAIRPRGHVTGPAYSDNNTGRITVSGPATIMSRGSRHEKGPPGPPPELPRPRAGRRDSLNLLPANSTQRIGHRLWNTCVRYDKGLR